MDRLPRRLSPVALAAAVLLAAASAPAISFSPFGGLGAGGAVNGQTLGIGPGGVVEELDAFLAIGGLDLNGGSPGVAADLSDDALPPGLLFAFSASLSPDTTDLTLHYHFENTGGALLSDVTFLSFLDVEIDEPLNTFFNEYAVVTGSPEPGQSWEVDEPGFLFGDIRDHLAAGVLDGLNAVPSAAPEDVSMAIGFSLGSLAGGESVDVQVMLSEDGGQLGSLALTQLDAVSSGTAVTYSGTVIRPEAAIPEPSGYLLFGMGLLLVLGLRR